MKTKHLPIENPCPASWDAMEGDDLARHCAHCDKTVHNLSAMSRAQAIRLMKEAECSGESLCVLYQHTTEGDVLFKSALQLHRQRLGLEALLAASALAFPLMGAVECDPAPPQRDARLVDDLRIIRGVGELGPSTSRFGDPDTERRHTIDRIDVKNLGAQLNQALGSPTLTVPPDDSPDRVFNDPVLERLQRAREAQKDEEVQAAASRVHHGVAEVRGGGCDEGVLEAVERQAQTMERCVHQALALNPRLRGHLVADLTINDEGEVGALVLYGDLGFGELEGCVSRHIQAWRFKPVEGRCVVSYPFTFQPPE